MWLATVSGWFSVVVDLQREDRMQIHARCCTDIHNLYAAHKDLPSIERPTSHEHRDYPWRMSIGKADWIRASLRFSPGQIFAERAVFGSGTCAA
jgi:hypothetical protein